MSPSSAKFSSLSVRFFQNASQELTVASFRPRTVSLSAFCSGGGTLLGRFVVVVNVVVSSKDLRRDEMRRGKRKCRRFFFPHPFVRAPSQTSSAPCESAFFALVEERFRVGRFVVVVNVVVSSKDLRRDEMRFFFGENENAGVFFTKKKNKRETKKRKKKKKGPFASSHKTNGTKKKTTEKK